MESAPGKENRKVLPQLGRIYIVLHLICIYLFSMSEKVILTPITTTRELTIDLRYHPSFSKLYWQEMNLNNLPVKNQSTRILSDYLVASLF